MLEIVPIRYTDILGAPNAAELVAEYAAECSIPEIGQINPQPQLYAAMEASGMMQDFGAYDDGKLIGFVSLLTYPLPHYGKTVTVTESLFVAMAKRRSGAGKALLDTATQYAKHKGSAVMQIIAPAGSTLEKLLSLHKAYRHTNSVFTRKL